jgi:hypothetical protein
MSISIKGGRNTVLNGECMDCGENKPIFTFYLNGKEVDICQECWIKQEAK